VPEEKDHAANAPTAIKTMRAPVVVVAVVLSRVSGRGVEITEEAETGV
jgi:hypothetical protein